MSNSKVLNLVHHTHSHTLNSLVYLYYDFLKFRILPFLYVKLREHTKVKRIMCLLLATFFVEYSL